MELRNNNREVIRELAQANYRKNRGRNRVLTLAVALAVFMVFGAFSIARGKMEADYLLYARNGGSVASLSLEDGTEKQYEKIKTLDYVKNVGLQNDFAVWQKDGVPVLGCTVLDNTAFEKLQKPAYTDVTGRYPQKENEVMLPLRGLEQLGIHEPSIGMTLNAELLFQEDRDTVKDSFVLSGYYKDYVNPILNAPTAYFSEKYLESQGISQFPVSYILMEQNGILGDGELMEEKLYEDVPTESDAQQFIGMNSLAFTVVEDFAGSYMVAFLCSVMILSGAFLLIYNVLSI
ncbi:MAG: ABC transporter permease, partial [Blautia coccoides]